MLRSSNLTRWIIGLLVAAALAAWVNHAYFFNPLTFRQDDVTYLPWSWYTAPMQVEYYVMDVNENRYTIQLDQDEVRFVIAELKKGLGLPLPDTKWNQPGGRQWRYVTIRLTDSQVNVLNMEGYWDHGTMALKPGGRKHPVPVRLTEELKELMKRRFDEAKPY